MNKTTSWNYNSNHRSCSVRKGVLRNFAKLTGKDLCQGHFFNKVAGSCTLFKKETPSQVFSCEFCEISSNIFFTEHLQVTVSEITQMITISFLPYITGHARNKETLHLYVVERNGFFMFQLKCTYKIIWYCKKCA